MMKPIVIIFLFLMTLSNNISAQTYVQFVDHADSKIDEGDYIEAVIYYKKAMELDSNSLEILWKIAEANRLQKNYRLAEWYYKKVFNREASTIFPMSIYWLASMQHYNGKYNRSARSWKSAKKVYKRDRDSFLYLKSVQELKSCLWASRASRDTAKIKIFPLESPINSMDAELAPVLITDSKIAFTALKADSIHNDESILTENYKLRIYQAEKKGDEFSEIKLLIEGDENAHFANGSLSADGKRFYFTKCNVNMNCKIFVGEFKNDKVINIDSLGEIINYEGAIVTTMPHIALIDNEEYLFFVSDRDFSYGGLDIWYSKVTDGNQYSLPMNLGNSINTPEDDISPFYNSVTNEIYYSTPWLNGFGGHDIFKAKKISSNFVFGSPVNLGLPINSSKNDSYFVIDTSDNSYYLSSNREGDKHSTNSTCCNDIFVVKPSKDTIKKRFLNLEDLNNKLPVTLFFHNDEPNPRSTDTTTRYNYQKTYNDYVKLRNTYKNEYSKGLRGDEREEAEEDIEDFFLEFVEQGFLDLELFAELLLEELKKGYYLRITIKGFASPLAKSDYNVNLTKRRIHSFINYLSEFDQNQFQVYLESGAISFVEIPYGEYSASNLVSDNYNDQKNSVYNRKAAFERKIEIQSVTINSDIESLGITTSKTVHDFGKVKTGIIKDAWFTLTNNSDSTIIIKEAISECKCLIPNLEQIAIKPKQSIDFKLRYRPIKINGKVIIRVMITFDKNPPIELITTSEIEN